MGLNDAAQLIILIVALAVSIPILGTYMARVYSSGKAPGDRVFGPLERLIYRVCGIDPKGEQRWRTYALSLLAFSGVSMLVLYGIQRLQDHLPLNPGNARHRAVAPGVQHRGELPDQHQLAELLGRDRPCRYLTQMIGLAVQNFVSAAVGIAVAVALIRGLVRRRSSTLGSFWVDLVRTRHAGPAAARHRGRARAGLDGRHPGLDRTGDGPHASPAPTRRCRPVRSAARRRSRTSAPTAAARSTPTRPTRSRTRRASPTCSRTLLLLIPFSLPWTFGKMCRDRRQGWRSSARWRCSGSSPALMAMGFEAGRQLLAAQGRQPDGLVNGRGRQPGAARKCASVRPRRRCSAPLRRAPRPDRSTPCTTALRRWAAGSCSPT